MPEKHHHRLKPQVLCPCLSRISCEPSMFGTLPSCAGLVMLTTTMQLQMHRNDPLENELQSFQKIEQSGSTARMWHWEQSNCAAATMPEMWQLCINGVLHQFVQSLVASSGEVEAIG